MTVTVVHAVDIVGREIHKDRCYVLKDTRGAGFFSRGAGGGLMFGGRNPDNVGSLKHATRFSGRELLMRQSYMPDYLFPAIIELFAPVEVEPPTKRWNWKKHCCFK